MPARSTYFLLSLLFLLAGALRPAYAAPPTMEDYQLLVSEAYAAAQRADRIGLDERADQLLTITEVSLPGGVRLPVDNSWLREALAQEPPAYPEIVGRLGAILDALGQPRTPPDPEALAKLERIFESPPFKSREVPSAWSRFWDAVGEAIADFFGRLFSGLPAPAVNPAPAQSLSGLSPAGIVLLVIGVLLVLAIVVYAVRGVRRSIVAEARARAEAVDEELLTASEASDLAQAGARSGDYRSAARYMYLSALLWLEERGLLRYDRSRTNREYLLQLQGKPAHATLAPVVETFERVWYGQQPLDAASFEEYERKVAALRSTEERQA